MSITSNIDDSNSSCIQNLCIDSNSGHDPAFGSYSDAICDSVGDMYAGSGQWACFSADNFLDDSVSSTGSFPMVRIDHSSYDDRYHELIQQLTFMIPQRFLETPIDEWSVVKSATKYIACLQQTLETTDPPYTNSDKSLKSKPEVAIGYTDYICVQPDNTFCGHGQNDEWEFVSGDDYRWHNSASLVSCSAFEDQPTMIPNTPAHPVALWQNKHLDTSLEQPPLQMFADTYKTCEDLDSVCGIDANLLHKRRKNSYTVMNDNSFSDIVPSLDENDGIFTCNDVSCISDNVSKRDERDRFTKIKDPGLRDSHDMTSIEKYPFLSSLLDETGFTETDNAKNSHATWSHAQPMVSPLKHFDRWIFPANSNTGDDDVFLPSSQTEPDSTTNKSCDMYKVKSQNTGLRRPKNGFIRFSVEFRKHLAKLHPKLDNREVSKMLGAKWRRMSHEEKIPYEMEFRKDISELRSKHPEWRYAPLKQMETEHIEPMPSRLRPRDKLKKKFLPTIIKYGPTISSKKQPRLQRKKRGKMMRYNTYNSFAWFQCKLCCKWRYVPCIDDGNLPIYQSMWFCHMNPDPTCNSCFAEDGLSINHTIMTSSSDSGYGTNPCSTVSVFSTTANMTML